MKIWVSGPPNPLSWPQKTRSGSRDLLVLALEAFSWGELQRDPGEMLGGLAERVGLAPAGWVVDDDCLPADRLQDHEVVHVPMHDRR